MQAAHASASDDGRAVTQTTLSSSIETLKGIPDFALQLQEGSAFEFLVQAHDTFLSSISKQCHLTAAATKVSDADGVFQKHSKDGGSLIRVQVHTWHDR